MPRWVNIIQKVAKRVPIAINVLWIVMILYQCIRVDKPHCLRITVLCPVIIKPGSGNFLMVETEPHLASPGESYFRV